MGANDGEAARQVGRNLRAIREQRGLSQNKMAEIVIMDPTRYGKMERGLLNLRLRTIERIAARLGVDPLELVNRPSR
jgi:transcriptional regulator with XRE-family HTH domain